MTRITQLKARVLLRLKDQGMWKTKVEKNAGSIITEWIYDLDLDVSAELRAIQNWSQFKTCQPDSEPETEA